MLILTRRPGERVVIGEDVLVTVMEVSGQTVRLGIAAPDGLPIYREEIWLAVKEENRAAAEAANDALPEQAVSAPAGEGDQRPV
ncbi:MAG TPA: carbon storage regulator CsrA [Solirubrobacteraceae bacterium]|jgi:carbon storage regulator|nr:carbon storage regulator CsrA [Solirubrobacteraceae bacterium]